MSLGPSEHAREIGKASMAPLPFQSGMVETVGHTYKYASKLQWRRSLSRAEWSEALPMFTTKPMLQWSRSFS